jgi:catechol 2,3-dioxygenase-like lactoylglutathione lyase family enzyme
MKRVIGIGGIFFKSKDPKALTKWYATHLGLPAQEWGGAQFVLDKVNTDVKDGYQLWNPFKEDTTYFEPGNQTFMLNFIVDDLVALLAALRTEGVEVMDKTDEGEFGKFGWCIDPDGNKVELWEPPKG